MKHHATLSKEKLHYRIFLKRNENENLINLKIVKITKKKDIDSYFLVHALQV